MACQQICTWLIELQRSGSRVIDEFQYRRQLPFVILDGRPCQRPGTCSPQSLQRVTRIIAVLYSLSFVGDDHVPSPCPYRRAWFAASVRSQCIVAYQCNIHRRRPLPHAIERRAAYDDGGQFRRPLRYLPSPLIQQPRRRNHQARPDRFFRTQNSHCGNRLHGLAQPHIIGQQQSIIVHQCSNSILLKGHQLTGPMQSGHRLASGPTRRRGEHRPQPFRQHTAARVPSTRAGSVHRKARLMRAAVPKSRQTDYRSQPAHDKHIPNTLVPKRFNHRGRGPIERLQGTIPVQELFEQPAPRCPLIRRFRSPGSPTASAIRVAVCGPDLYLRRPDAPKRRPCRALAGESQRGNLVGQTENQSRRRNGGSKKGSGEKCQRTL